MAFNLVILVTTHKTLHYPMYFFFGGRGGGGEALPNVEWPNENLGKEHYIVN